MVEAQPDETPVVSFAAVAPCYYRNLFALGPLRWHGFGVPGIARTLASSQPGKSA